jgi:hypothetical protein
MQRRNRLKTKPISNTFVDVRLQSTMLIHAPGMLKRLSQMYKSEKAKDRAIALETTLSLFNRTVSRRIVKDILNGMMQGTLSESGDEIIFRIPTSDFFPLNPYILEMEHPILGKHTFRVYATGHPDAETRANRILADSLKRALENTKIVKETVDNASNDAVLLE